MWAGSSTWHSPLRWNGLSGVIWSGRSVAWWSALKLAHLPAMHRRCLRPRSRIAPYASSTIAASIAAPIPHALSRWTVCRSAGYPHICARASGCLRVRRRNQGSKSSSGSNSSLRRTVGAAASTAVSRGTTWRAARCPTTRLPSLQTEPRRAAAAQGLGRRVRRSLTTGILAMTAAARTAPASTPCTRHWRPAY